MEPEGSLPHSQEPATCPHPEPDQSGSCTPSHLLKINFNIILPSTPGPSKLSLSLRFPCQNSVRSSTLPKPATCHAHFILLDLNNRKTFGEEYRTLSSSLSILLYSPIISSLSGSNIILSILYSKTFNPSSSLNMSDQVPHPYKKTGKIKFLYNLIFIFLDSKLTDKRCCTE